MVITTPPKSNKLGIMRYVFLSFEVNTSNPCNYILMWFEVLGILQVFDF
jgi:hypothetical protein